MRRISEIKPFEEEFESLVMPQSRIIGKEARCGGELGNTAPALAEKTINSPDWITLKNLPHVMEYSCGWTGDYDAKTDTFSYIVGFITPADTPVPDGFVYRDIAETLCAKGLFGENIDKTVERAKDAGFVTNWESCPWNAEFYIEEEEKNPPKKNCESYHWLVPVKKA